MIYIVTALKPEAQAFIDRYKLLKSRLNSYAFFSNNKIKVIISGLGVYNSMMATQTLIDNFDIKDEDIFINVGICGADKSYRIGELIEIGSIVYDKKKYIIDKNITTTITCQDTEAKSSENSLVDMESFGFYDAIIHSPAIKEFHIFKVVSDYFEPEKVTKDKTKSLIFNVIDDILKKV